MDYAHAFQSLADESDAKQQLALQELTSIDHLKVSLPKLLRYCQLWCCLAEALWREHPSKLHSPLEFEMPASANGERFVTSSYWCHLVDAGSRLGEMALQSVFHDLDLDRSLAQGSRVSIEQVPLPVRDSLNQQNVAVLGVLSYCKHRALERSLHVARLLPVQCRQLESSFQAIRLVTCWLLAGDELQLPVLERNAQLCADLLATALAADARHRLAFERIAAVTRDCKVQAWLNKAQWLDAHENLPGAAVAAYRQAEALGWELTLEAHQLIDDNANSLRQREPQLAELNSLEPVGEEKPAWLTVGQDPLQLVTFEPPQAKQS